ncbi:nonsense-mediated mRNA decay factor SMG5 isoform X1 [Cloeon dipterum]|uniref:nonsense-mediated mRNA decay factor SMG5 isoform X1 n=1 Tax=Cloeon dipterum TaxID=197152 RepID=UPI00322086C3
MSAESINNAMGTFVQHAGQSMDQSRRHLKGLQQLTRQLEDQQARASSVAQLFSLDLVSRRAKITDQGAKIALIEPKVVGRTCEDILWRKVFHSAYSRAKQLNNSGDSDDSALIRHLLAGIGFYHGFILKIQTEFRVCGSVDYSASIGMQQLSADYKNKTKSYDRATLDWATKALERSLIALGDLHRYLSTLRPSYSGVISARFYVLASQVNPKSSMPFNQLGALATAQGKKFEAAYFYLRCLCCDSPYECAEANLRRALKNDAPQLKAGSKAQARVFLTKFLSLIDTWWFNENFRDINLIFEDCMLEFKANLTLVKPASSAETPAAAIENMFKEELELTHFSSDLLVKMMAILLMTYHKLEKQSPAQASSVVVFIFNIVNCLTKKLVSGPVPVAKKKPVRQKRRQRLMRRRRKVGGDCSEESECESEDGVDSQASSDTSSDSAGSESEFLGSSSDEEEVEKNVLKSQELPALSCIKLCCDWLQTNDAVLRSFFSNFQPLFEDFVKFLNAVAHDCSLVLKNSISNESYESITQNDLFADAKISGSLEEVAKTMQPYPLPEDVTLQGHVVVDQSSLNWSLFNSSPIKSDTLIRMCKLVHFGVYMANSSMVGVKFDKESNAFSLIQDFIPPSIKPVKEPVNKDHQKKLMQHMGQLWLQEEVRNLESRVSHGKGNCAFSPYIVVDSSALLSKLHLVKLLIKSKQFVVVIPSVVLEGLDNIKKESGSARESVRFLEILFREGNRFLRQQRENESLSIPLIKCPKKKDKDAIVFFKILECCNYLVQQVPRENRLENNINMVTLLCATIDSSQKDFSPTGLAASAGVKIETITDFYHKWKKSKKAGKK